MHSEEQKLLDEAERWNRLLRAVMDSRVEKALNEMIRKGEERLATLRARQSS